MNHRVPPNIRLLLAKRADGRTPAESQLARFAAEA